VLASASFDPVLIDALRHPASTPKLSRWSAWASTITKSFCRAIVASSFVKTRVGVQPGMCEALGALFWRCPGAVRFCGNLTVGTHSVPGGAVAPDEAGGQETGPLTAVFPAACMDALMTARAAADWLWSTGWLGEAGTGRSDGARGDGASVVDCIDISGFEERASRRHDQLRYHRGITTTTSGTRTCRQEDAGTDVTRPSLLDLVKDLSRNIHSLKHTRETRYPVRPGEASYMQRLLHGVMRLILTETHLATQNVGMYRAYYSKELPGMRRGRNQRWKTRKRKGRSNLKYRNFRQ
jgi:hypothetical protein